MRDIERQRLRSLVTRDMAAADVLHADDYQLITPRGIALSKEEYLGDIASGHLRYQVFEAVSDIVVRSSDQLAIVRYRARIGVSADHGDFLFLTCWHTDCYELREGRWQAVWSQATAVD
ncbi:nuclear transport factor 2 family protein [Nonomuraea sp. NPDC049158]|uniref:nuclear transport factor 2 family protein n=1 Tax=Nonomuraea sp. NPDC049158 TaxID=3155649 RepID=UPI0033C301E2